MKILLKVFFFIFILAIVVYFICGRIFSNKKTSVYDSVQLSQKFPNGYISKSVNIDGLLVSYAVENSEIMPGDYTDVPGCKVYPSLKPTVFTKNDIYEIDMQNMCAYNQLFITVDIDGDGKKEIASEWISTAGGSGDIKTLIIWKTDKAGRLFPLAGYPDEMFDKGTNNERGGLEVTNTVTGKKFSFGATSSNQYVEYNFYSQPPYKIRYGGYIWNFEEQESHFSPHIWKLSVFTFDKNKFVRDETWNNGSELITTKKYAVDDLGFKELKNIFETTKTEEIVMNMLIYKKPDTLVKFSYPQIKSGLTANQITQFNEFSSKSAEKIYLSQISELPNEWSSDTQIIRSDSKVISARINNYEYFKDAAHGDYSTNVINYSIGQSKGLNLNDLFIENSDYLNQLSKLIKEKLIQGYKDQGNDYSGLISTINDGTKPNPVSFSKFVIGKDYLLFVFDPYEVGSYADGTREAKVTFQELQGFLKPNLLII